jgi:hypothetical protein
MGWKFSQAYAQKKYPRLHQRKITAHGGVWELYKIEGPATEPRLISVMRDRDEQLQKVADILRVSGVQDARLQWEPQYYLTLDPSQGRDSPDVGRATRRTAGEAFNPSSPRG